MSEREYILTHLFFLHPVFPDPQLIIQQMLLCTVNALKSSKNSLLLGIKGNVTRKVAEMISVYMF